MIISELDEIFYIKIVLFSNINKITLTKKNKKKDPHFVNTDLLHNHLDFSAIEHSQHPISASQPQVRAMSPMLRMPTSTPLSSTGSLRI